MLICGIGFAYGWSKADMVEKVGHIPGGIASPMVPKAAHWAELAGDAFPIAVISYFTSLSLASTFANQVGCFQGSK